MSTAALKRILMVEDDPDIQIVARLSLEAVGQFTVSVCSGGEEALQIVQSFAPDLVLLDVMMPDMDGPTVLQRLRADAQTASLPVVFMTAKAQAQEVASYKGKGALAVISKPFDPMELPHLLTQVWADYVHSTGAATAPRVAGERL
ncbi:MAG TPA: response regulator [Abditibacterium sp.]|jgi:CheY-like chemotaxis protein